MVGSHDRADDIVSSQSFVGRRRAHPCVKPYDSNLSQPVNECPRCTHDFYNGNMSEHAQFKDVHV